MSRIKVFEADPSHPDHAAAIIRLLDEYASHPMGGGSGLSDFTKANLPAELAKRPTARVILAFVDGAAAGMIISFEGFSTFQCKPLLNLHDVIVSATFRGTGLSKLLLAKAEELARDLGCCKLTLEVLEGNTAARAAYQACGFYRYELDPEMGKAMFWEKPV